VCFYLATLFLFGWLGFPFVYWSGFMASGVATAATVLIWERGNWNLGLHIPLVRIAAEVLRGTIWAVVLIGTIALFIVATSSTRHHAGTGFPWLAVFSIFIPAAIHEELLFRGYLFQKLASWNRTFALGFGAIFFMALHLGNHAVGPLALFNIFLGGILLGLAYLATRTLWFPIALHLAWNVMTGPVLGHEVSGNDSMQTLLTVTGGGPVWITGGDFGIEASIWATLAELAAIALLARKAYPPRAERLTSGLKEQDQ
jgi:membrane protease YdiL (CAAX protease family)